jgi:hypothetical protein
MREKGVSETASYHMKAAKSPAFAFFVIKLFSLPLSRPPALSL